jgi:hypothetical protein
MFRDTVKPVAISFETIEQEGRKKIENERTMGHDHKG